MRSYKMAALFFAFLLGFTGIAAIPAYAAPQTPELAAAAIMEEIKSWDAAMAAGSLDESIGRDMSAVICEGILNPLLSKVDYEIGNSKTIGRRAEVDLTITAPDVEEILTGIVSDALGIAAIRQLTGIELDLEGILAKRVARSLNEDNLRTIRSNTTMYLALGGDGAWKLDTADARNLELLEALTGGLADIADLLEELFGAEASQLTK